MTWVCEPAWSGPVDCGRPAYAPFTASCAWGPARMDCAETPGAAAETSGCPSTSSSCTSKAPASTSTLPEETDERMDACISDHSQPRSASGFGGCCVRYGASQCETTFVGG